ncbi:MAG: hypothetical protein L3K09_06155 [Thermoplasmata archaeon]|nr:hypothetical protein [Thermoplasmata archaeon]
MSYSTLELCSGRSGYEAVPRPRLSLDLAGVRRRMEAKGIPVIDARVMLIARLAHEVTVSRDGRIMIKSTDPKTAVRLFEEVKGYLELSGP